jgi:hypothetical protein
MVIKARFKGEEGSMGYKNDRVYDLRVIMNPGKFNLHIENLDGTQQCPYSSIYSFLNNWDLVDICMDINKPLDRKIEQNYYKDLWQGVFPKEVVGMGNVIVTSTPTGKISTPEEGIRIPIGSKAFVFGPNFITLIKDDPKENIKYFMGHDPGDSLNRPAYCLIKTVGGTVEVLLSKICNDEHGRISFQEEAHNVAKAFNADIKEF